ncbi:MAG: DUF2934 domain-containing protein [Vicinamibacterales bacterium]
MAKKTSTPRSKTTPKAEAAELAPATKPRVRRTTKAAADTLVVETASIATTVSASVEPTDEEIRLRAYHRYLERGGGDGMDFDDWLEAKRDLERGYRSRTAHRIADVIFPPWAENSSVLLFIRRSLPGSM